MTQEPAPPAASLAYLRDDDAFDALYPEGIRRVSRRFWTPLETARRGALLLADAGATKVLDVGSGVGKFALVAAATVPRLRVVGIEQRAHLLEPARAASAKLGLSNVTFFQGDATDVSWSEYDGFYFYNSFAENLFDPSDRLDDRAVLSFARFARDVQRTYAALRVAKAGTAVVTFYGSSGRMPCSYELVHQAAAGSGWLRLWVKGTSGDDGSFLVEDGEAVVKHDATGQEL